MNKFSAVIAIAAVGLCITSAHAQSKDLVDTALSDPQFSTLAKALKASGLDKSFKGRGPYTVFAPTNAAFAKLPPGALDKVLADRPALRKLLAYHVVPGKITSSDLKPMDVKSVGGPTIAVKTSPAPMVNNAKIVKADIVASNGVIHAIDTVLMPGKEPVRKHRMLGAEGRKM